VCVGLLAALLIAPLRSEYATKVAVLGALAIVCAVRPLLARLPLPRLGPRRLALAGVAALAVHAGVLVAGGLAWRAPATATAASSGALPALTILPSKGVENALERKTSRRTAADLATDPH